MAAGINDKFKETFNSANPNVTFVSTQRSAAATTLICDSLAGWPTNTAVDFITYQLDTDGETVVPGSQRDWKGIVSGNTITNLTLIAGGADAGNQVNDIVEMTPTANWANDLIEGILVGHDQDGTHKSKGLTLGKINGGSTDGVLLTDSSGNVTGGKVTAVKTNFGGDYSTSEVDTGFTWVDGKTIYKKTISLGALPDNGTKEVSHGIVGLDYVISMNGATKNGTTGAILPLPNVASSLNATISILISSSSLDKIQVVTANDRTAYTTSYVTLYYTKT